jgi:hypothetical protein
VTDKTRYAFDTEFIEDGRTIDLISIGIVCEDGREYYAVNSDAPWDRVERGSMINLPKGIPMWTHDIQQAMERAPEGFKPPEQVEGQHNALEDARHNMRVLTALRGSGVA